MKTFKKGDRVIYSPRSTSSAPRISAIGKRATIVEVDLNLILIEFDENVGGHRPENHDIKQGCGWYVNILEIKSTRGRKPKKELKSQALTKLSDAIEDSSMRSLLASYAAFVQSAVKFKDANDESTLNKLIDFKLIENQIINLGEDLKAALITIKESEDGNQ